MENRGWRKTGPEGPLDREKSPSIIGSHLEMKALVIFLFYFFFQQLNWNPVKKFPVLTSVGNQKFWFKKFRKPPPKPFCPRTLQIATKILRVQNVSIFMVEDRLSCVHVLVYIRLCV